MSLLAEALSKDSSPSYTYEEIELPELTMLGTVLYETNPLAILQRRGSGSLCYFPHRLRSFIETVEKSSKVSEVLHYFKQTGLISSLVNSYRNLPQAKVVLFPTCRLGVFKGSEQIVQQSGLVLEHFIKWRLYVVVKDGNIVPVRYQYMYSEQEIFIPTVDYVFDPEHKLWMVYKAGLEETLYDIVKRTDGFTNVRSSPLTNLQHWQVTASGLVRPNKILDDSTIYRQIEPTKASAEQIYRSIERAINSEFYHQDGLARRILKYATTIRK